MKNKVIYLLVFGLVGCNNQLNSISNRVSKETWFEENKNGKAKKYFQDWTTKKRVLKYYKISDSHKKDELYYKGNQYLDAYKYKNKSRYWKPININSFSKSSIGKQYKYLGIMDQLRENYIYDICKKVNPTNKLKHGNTNPKHINSKYDLLDKSQIFERIWTHKLKYGNSIFEKDLSYVAESGFGKIPDFTKKINSFKDSFEFRELKERYDDSNYYISKKSIVINYGNHSGIIDSGKGNPPKVKIPDFPSGYNHFFKSSKMDLQILEGEKTQKGKEGIDQLYQSKNIFETKNPSKFIVKDKSFAEQYYDKGSKKEFYAINSLNYLFSTSNFFKKKMNEGKKSQSGENYLKDQYLASEESTSDWKKDTR